MKEFTVGSTALFKVDDTDDPGVVRVRLLSENVRLSKLLPWKIWKVEMLEVVKPSTAEMKSQPGLGPARTLGKSTSSRNRPGQTPMRIRPKGTKNLQTLRHRGLVTHGYEPRRNCLNDN